MSTHSRFVGLIAKWKKVRCTYSDTYFHWTETNPDGHGGRIAKIFDYQVHDQTVEQSKYKKGQGWQRGLDV